jgi:hypothetical protein
MAAEQNTAALFVYGDLTNALNNIPDDAKISGFAIHINGRSEASRAQAYVVQFVKSTLHIGTNQASTNTEKFTPDGITLTYGGLGNFFDLGSNLTGADVKNADLGVVLRFRNTDGSQSTTLSIDMISMTIYYNRKPVAVNDLFSAPSAGNVIAGNVLLNDSDPENNALITTVETPPAEGNLVLNANGTFTYTPQSGFEDGIVQFTYRATDNGNPSQFSTATVTLVYPAKTLPVEFISFDAKKSGSGVLLTWSVGTEVNVDRYEVERSNDGAKFTKIGSLLATHNSSYSFTDLQPLTGTSYYRVRNVDHDGQFKYTIVLKYQNGNAIGLFKAFPTVTQGMVTFQHPSAREHAVITITSLEGKTLRSIIPAHGSISTPIDFSALPAGTYLLRYQGESSQPETFKILKQ